MSEIVRDINSSGEKGQNYLVARQNFKFEISSSKTVSAKEL